MKHFALIAALFTSALAIAIPAPVPQDDSSVVLDQAAAEKLIAEYASLQSLTASDIGDPSTTANAILADDFQETSDSLNELIGLPLGTVTFPDKQSYINAVLNTTPVTIDTIKLLVSGNYITWYWNIPEHSTLGFSLFEINSSLQIDQVWLEFNSIAYLESLGGSCSAPASTKRLFKL